MANDYAKTMTTSNGTVYDIHDARLDSLESGTIATAIGLDSSGDLVKGAAGGGTQLYIHKYTMTGGDYDQLEIVSINSDAKNTYYQAMEPQLYVRIHKSTTPAGWTVYEMLLNNYNGTQKVLVRRAFDSTSATTQSILNISSLTFTTGDVIPL